MSNKQINFILIFIVICIFLYFLSLGLISNKLTELNIKKTQLEKDYKKIKNITNSMIGDIEILNSMDNFNKIAKEKHFNKPSDDQIVYIYIKNDKNKEN